MWDYVPIYINVAEKRRRVFEMKSKKGRDPARPIEPIAPTGELVIQTVAMPADANAYGDIFGGWLLSQMDVGGAVLAHQRAHNRVATVAIDKLTFMKPVYVGDLVCCYAKTFKTGHSSITIQLQVFASRMRIGAHEQVAEGLFTFVAIDDNGRPKSINW